MGVSVYVMPLRRYLTGRFTPTWEIRSETAEGAPGFRITGHGAEGPPGRPRRSPPEADAWIAAFHDGLRERRVEPDWTDEGDALLAAAFSYSSFGRVSELAGRFAGQVRFRHLEDPLRPFMIPVRFHRPLEIRDPSGGEEPLVVLSAVEAREELVRMEALLRDDERLREIESLPPGSVLTGRLYEYGADVGVVRRLLEAVSLGVENRMPVIVEG